MLINSKKKKWWFKSVILATWEAEIRRITVGGQSGQKVPKTSSQPTVGCSGMYLSFHLHGEAQIGGSRYRSVWA
jgi:hypothetical protein